MSNLQSSRKRAFKNIGVLPSCQTWIVYPGRNNFLSTQFPGEHVPNV